jgi:CIC family chloride channel protein
VIARRLEPDSLYSGRLRRRGERIEQGSDRSLLANLTVRDAYSPAPQVFRADAPLATLLAHLRPGEQTTFPVVDAAGALLGVVTMADLARLTEEASSSEDGRVAADVAGPTEAVTLSDTLLEANRRMGVRGTPVLPVLAVDSHRLIGIVSRSHILAAYERALTEGKATGH